MDFGALDSLVFSGYDFCGSGGVAFKQERSVSATALNQDEWRDLKMAEITRDDFTKAMLQQQQQQQQRSNSDSQHMLSFSSPNTQTATLPYYARNTTATAGVKGPFTPSQWMELEHQALIYKYITLNAPIPSNLLFPIRKALEAAAFSAYPGPHRIHTAYGWGAFHLGFSNNSDREPGRCRRTDGKKWRCSRDAVADQKYCERHMNRGRHRSRKPVEGHSGHSATTAAAGNHSALPAAAAVTTTSTIVSHSTIPAASSHHNKSFLTKANLASEFGLVCSDSLLNPLQKKKNNNGGQKSQNSLHQFMDDWPHSDKTQLSISIPISQASSLDFMSSNSSLISERLNLSPLRMGLGVVNTNTNTFSERQQANWIPVSWETSMGGPLGEVLHHGSTNNSPSALNLMTEGWESSTQMGLSPTGVLQKTAFGSVSNSSTGSSPRTDSNLLGSTHIGSSLPY